MEVMPEDSWVAFMDWDAMLLSHKSIGIIYDYVNKFPDTGLFLAMSNRSGSRHQQHEGHKSFNYDMSAWLLKGHTIVPTLEVTELFDNLISGFLMLISKKTWNEIKFSEELDVLHVDRDYAQRILENGKKIRIMNDILVWHSYRLLFGTQYKKHLLNE